MTEDFDLHAFVLDVAAASSTADPYVIADHVLEQMPRRAHRDALEVALRPYVAHVVRLEMHNAVRPPIENRDQSPSGSARWANARSILGQRLNTPDGYKFVRDLTAADLRATAEVRRVQAAGNIAWAERYEKLAAMLDEVGAVSVGDLGDAEARVREVLS